MHVDVRIAESDMDLQREFARAAQFRTDPKAMTHNGAVLQPPAPGLSRLAEPVAGGADDLRLGRRTLVDLERGAVGNDGLEADGILGARFQRRCEDIGKLSRRHAVLGHLLRHGFDANHVMGRLARDFAHLLPGMDGVGAMAGIDQQAVQSGCCEETPVDLRRTQLQPARDIGFAAAERLQIQQRRAEAPDDQAERFLEFAGSGRRRQIAFAEHRLERFVIELRRRDAMAMMVDQRQIEN
jgi:hypothetical protein